MTSFSRMRISVAVNGSSSSMESVLNVGLYLEKMGFYSQCHIKTRLYSLIYIAATYIHHAGMLFTLHRYHNHIIVLICIVFTLSMLIYIQPRSRIHVVVTRSSYATLYLSEWPWHTTPGHIISYTNLPLSICCEYSKEPSLCGCSLEHPEHMHTPLPYQKKNPPQDYNNSSFKTHTPSLDNPSHFGYKRYPLWRVLLDRKL